jgi:hypothetical protein
MSTTRRLLAVGVVLASLTGCSGSEASSTPNSGGAPPVLPTGSGSLNPGNLPTGVPGGTGTLTNATASLEVNGDLQASIGFADVYGATVYAPPPVSTLVVGFVGSKPSEVLAIGGRADVGATQTSATLGLNFVVETPDGGVATFLSTQGECTVTIETAEATHVAGTFECSDISTADGRYTVGATGSFDAAE